MLDRTKLYLNHASIYPLQTHVKQAIASFMDEWQVVDFVYYQRLMRLSQSIRESISTLINCKPNLIALTPNTASSISVLMNGLAWKAGDEIILMENDFPSVTLASVPLKEKGVVLRTLNEVAFLKDPVGQLDAILNEKTRLVCISLVGFTSGFPIPVEDIAQACKQNNTLLAVDGTQAIGAINFDFVQSKVDFLAVSTYKWLMCPLGTSFFVCSDALFQKIKPSMIGWLSVENPQEMKTQELNFAESARRFESGGKPILSLVGTKASLDFILSKGLDTFIKPTQQRVKQLYEGLTDLGYSCMYDGKLTGFSGIVSVDACDFGDQLKAYLDQHHIMTTHRLGKIRFSPGYYQTEADINYLFDCLKQFKS